MKFEQIKNEQLTNKQLQLIIGGKDISYGHAVKDIGKCIWSGFKNC